MDYAAGWELLDCTLAMCLCDALVSILMARESGIWNTGWS